MFGLARLAYFVTILALLGTALAANLYRLDFRTPKEIHDAGGMVSREPNGKGSVIEHVKAILGDKDPWVSTTSDKKLAQKGAKSPGNAYVYYIYPSGLEIKDTIKEFKKAKQEHPHPAEKEFSVKSRIPWKNIEKWETYKRGKLIETTTREEYKKGHEGESSPKKGARGRSIRSFIA
ncbi:hypothetical protein QQS21_004204 [Conoideocrella luteorostrata]|uniref:Uncharacterized protein n=1 Tax=Conoideocrella luteorostrata TaxID=1105319 RepID=A0AAJ0CS01_9HYPO|nr:hypothetical protein QQS21_004204 [Conoideocrella luteorostrata]